MTERSAGPRGAPVVAGVVLVIGVVATLVLAGIHLEMLRGGTGGDVSIALLAPAMLAYATLGWTILRHHPGHRVGWVLLASVPMVDTVFLGFTVPGTGVPEMVSALMIWLALVLFAPAVLMAFPALGVLFPDGHLPGRSWRLPLGLVAGTAIAGGLMVAFAPGVIDTTLPPNPFGLPFLPEALRGLGTMLGLVSIVAGSVLAIASVAVRLRRSRTIEREQMKWMLGAITIVAFVTVPTLVGGEVPDWLSVVSSLSLVLIPAAATVAILRYRLYEIDRLISRTLGWAIVTGLLAAVFAGAVVGLQAALARFIPGSSIAVAASTLLVLALFQPLRGRVQRGVDRRFNRSSYDAQAAADEFAGRLRGLVDLGGVHDALLGTVAEALEPRTESLWIRGAGDLASATGPTTTAAS
jgi:hypothetical protein